MSLIGDKHEQIFQYGNNLTRCRRIRRASDSLFNYGIGLIICISMHREISYKPFKYGNPKRKGTGGTSTELYRDCPNVGNRSLIISWDGKDDSPIFYASAEVPIRQTLFLRAASFFNLSARFFNENTTSWHMS